LIQNKTDGKIVELPPLRQVSDYREPNQTRENENTNQPEKINSIVVEYNFLLTSQLQLQRQYFEDQLEKFKKETDLQIESMKKKCIEYDNVKEKLQTTSNKVFFFFVFYYYFNIFFFFFFFLYRIKKWKNILLK
jgi:BRCA1-associated protein